MTNPREHLADWLRDAYAMEHQGIEMFEKQADRLKEYPDIRSGLAGRAEQSKRNAGTLKQCLQLLGEDTSAFKTGLGKVVGTVQALTGLFVEDEVVKGCVAAYVFQYYKIGNYRVLMVAAEMLEQQEIARHCREIMQEEEQAAQWMEKNIPVATQEFLREEAAEGRYEIRTTSPKNKDENAKDKKWKVPVEVPSVKPEDYPANSSNSSILPRSQTVTPEDREDPAVRQQKERGQYPLHDEKIGGA